jgi:hypothetical protein
MKRLTAILLLFALSGCADLEEALMPDTFDDACYVGSMPYYPTPPPPVSQSSSVIPASHSTGTTQEPELLNPRR